MPEGSTLADALDVSKAFYRKGTAIGILKEAVGRKSEGTREYKIITSRGDFGIELSDEDSDSRRRWLEHFEDYVGLPVRWVSKDAISFGSVETDMSPVRGSRNFGRFELVFGAGGFDPGHTHLIFTKNKHSSEYGIPEEGVFAKVISGRNVFLELDRGDTIEGIEPVVEWEQLGERLCTTDLSTQLEDGSKIFTYIGAQMSPHAPEGAEHFFALTRDGRFKVDFVSSSYIADDMLQGEKCTYENFEPRNEGAISVRTVGYGTGRVFISRDDRTATIMHSIVGHVVQGLDLVKMADVGQTLAVESIPEPIMLLGMSVEQAKERLSQIGVEITAEGHLEEDGVIVSQEPATTIDILAQAQVKVQTVPSSHLVRVKLYDELAPKTLDFFRHVTGLQFKPVGNLPVVITYENTCMLKAEIEAELYKEIMPENTPKGKISSGEIGVTNQASKRMGMVGVKAEDDDLFGPTGEKFENTNLVGRVLDIDNLKNFNEGDIMYIVEVKEDE